MHMHEVAPLSLICRLQDLLDRSPRILFSPLAHLFEGHHFPFRCPSSKFFTKHDKLLIKLLLPDLMKGISSLLYSFSLQGGSYDCESQILLTPAAFGDPPNPSPQGRSMLALASSLPNSSSSHFPFQSRWSTNAHLQARTYLSSLSKRPHSTVPDGELYFSSAIQFRLRPLIYTDI